MANGYIGKISAVVTANTSDLSRKLQGAVKDVDRFANTLNRSVSASAQRAAASLDNIFTPLQRLERKLQTALRLNLRTDAQVQKIQQLVSVAEGINKPLERAAGSFSKLSLEVQAAFLPALSRAQGEALDAQGFIERLGRVSDETFVRVQRRVLDAAAAINQLSQAQQRLNSLATGNELQFSDPRLAGNLAAAQRAGQNALSLSPAQIQADPQIEKLVRDIGELSQRAVQAAANVKNIRFSGGDARAAQAQYDDINEELGILISRLNKKYTLVIDTEAAKKNANEIREALAFSVTGRARNFDQLKSQLEAARGEVEKFDAVQRRAFAKNFGRLAAIIETNDVAKLQEASDILGRINALIGARKQYDIDTAESDSALQRLQERLNGIAESLRVTPSDEFDRLEQSANDARAAIDKVADARARASLNRRAALVERGVREDAANPALTAADRRRRAGLDAAALGAIGRDAAEADRRVRESRLDRNADASTRLIDRVGPSVTALRGQLDGLAEPLRASVGPEVDRVTNKFRLLSRDGVRQSAEAVQRLKGEIAGLNAALESRRSIGRDFLQSFGGSGTAGLGLGVDQRSLRAIGAEIEFVQTRLASLGQQARGPVLAALEALRVAANRLFQDGAIDTDEGRAELERLRQELIRVAATAENVKPDQFGAALKRAGDIARGSFGNVGLAVQQAAFAFEDFFSVTGGLDQRIRAAGNNLSQLGFILGSTKGLIAGIVIGVGAQFAAMLIKWANNGRTAEDQTRALNEALSRQKSIAEDIARSFESLADTISRGLFSEAGERVRTLTRSLDELRRKQRELRDSRVVDLDPAVRLERATQGARQRELESETNVGRRIALQGLIEASRRREQDAAAAARDRAAPTAREIEAGLRRTVFVDGQRGPSPLARRRFGEIRQQVADAQGDPRQLLALLRAAQEEQNNLAIQNSFNQVRATAARANSEAIERLIAGLERQVAEDVDRQVIDLFKSIDQPARRIRQAQDTIAQALEAGIPGARELATAVDAASTELTAAEQRIIDRLNAGQPVDQELADAARQQRDAAVKAFEAEQQKVAAIDSTRRSLETFSAALDRVSTELANTVAQEARSLSDQARRDANQQQGVLDAGLGGRRQDADEADARASRLADQAADIERRAAAIRADNIRARAAFLGQAAAGGLGDRAQELVRSRNAAIAVLENQQATDGDRTNAQASLEVINQQLQAIFEQSGLAQRAAEAANELDRLAAVAKRQDELVQRGRELGRSPAEQAGRQLADDLRALVAARDAGALDGDFAVASQRIIEDSLRAAAPAIFGLADSVQNAVLQGPSRASLEATDVSSVEGARELNRLLRGDDAGRDQNLVELQKQSRSLDELVRIAREGGAVIAN